MEFITLTEKDAAALESLQRAYKLEIGEAPPAAEDLSRLAAAMAAGQIVFYACEDGGELVGCCSVSPTFSTFDYRPAGVFEDFYLRPEYRHTGLARRLVQFAREQSGVSTLTVGCAECDVGMYNALGFTVPLGNLLAAE